MFKRTVFMIQGQCAVYAWVLMTNHIHLHFKSGKEGHFNGDAQTKSPFNPKFISDPKNNLIFGKFLFLA
jgi:hypothetical protein